MILGALSDEETFCLLKKVFCSISELCRSAGPQLTYSNKLYSVPPIFIHKHLFKFENFGGLVCDDNLLEILRPVKGTCCVTNSELRRDIGPNDGYSR